MLVHIIYLMLVTRLRCVISVGSRRFSASSPWQASPPSLVQLSPAGIAGSERLQEDAVAWGQPAQVDREPSYSSGSFQSFQRFSVCQMETDYKQQETDIRATVACLLSITEMNEMNL